MIVKGISYEGTRGLFELLTRKKVDRSFITDSDMKAYRAIHEATHCHLENNNPSGIIKTTRGAKYKDVISKLFPFGRVTRRGSESKFEENVDHIKIKLFYKKVPGLGLEPTIPMQGLRA